MPTYVQEEEDRTVSVERAQAADRVVLRAHNSRAHVRAATAEVRVGPQRLQHGGLENGLGAGQVLLLQLGFLGGIGVVEESLEDGCVCEETGGRLVMSVSVLPRKIVVSAVNILPGQRRKMAAVLMNPSKPCWRWD